MDIGLAFGSITKDEKWVTKVLIGGLLMIVPILNALVLYGYGLEVARNVARGDASPFPEWDNFGDKIKRGLYGIVIALVYALPVIILQIGLQVLMVLAGAMGGDDAAGLVGLISMCMAPVLFVLGIAIWLFIMAAFVRYIQTDSLSEALKFSEVYQMVRNSLGTWFMLFLVYLLASLVGAAGMIACGVGMFFTIFFGMVAFFHALGQVVAQMGGVGGGVGSGIGGKTIQL